MLEILAPNVCTVGFLRIVPHTLPTHNRLALHYPGPTCSGPGYQRDMQAGRSATLRSNAVTKPQPRWTTGAGRFAAAMLSTGAALASILSYTGSAGLPALGGHVSTSDSRAYSIRLVPAVDTADAIGDTIQLAAVVTDSTGSVLMGIAPGWTSADPAIAAVSQAGTVTVQGAGGTARGRSGRAG